MTDHHQELVADEQKLVKLYMELTGATEASARSVLMLVQPDATAPVAATNPEATT